ncbi:MAG: FAD-dependent oxidoreductase [Microthrixaceae bacterium]
MPIDATDPMTIDPVAAHALVAEHAEQFIDERLTVLLPGLADEDGSVRRDEILDTYSRANVDPSDRYVQSLPGTDELRLRPDGSGFDNLYLAGDWTDNGLNAGCIEAAVLSGLQAANAILGHPRHHRILGTYLDSFASRFV